MISKLKQKARGHWDFIVSTIAPSTLDAINSNCSHVPCPIHGGQDGFRVYRDFNETGGSVCNTCGNFSDGFATLEFATGLSISEVITQVRDLLEDKPVLVSRKAKAASLPKPKTAANKATDRLRAAWLQSSQNDTSLIEKYVASRGLPVGLADVWASQARQNSVMRTYQKVEGVIVNFGVQPAILSIVYNGDDQAISLHRTYLDSEGAKNTVLPNAKTLMPSKEGVEWFSCSVRLGDVPAATLNLAEGIETSLAVMAMGESHCWATVNAQSLAGFTPPENIKEVVVWADLDKSETGFKAAQSLQERLCKEGVEVIIKLPPMPIPKSAKSVDWLDYYVSLPK
ncbi:toprim domain-containing protein [Marinospirillum insulare]|uniref:DNA primase n=1 Tax=Marinospirillum insulare TaxID=217169 RepID=A0ABQ5ZXX3_9GAMM|nr:toprim domain-containing protein [Marinospirillum insulare]GLR65050.1 DNA primase [Marinospirillum insulare]